MALHTRQQQQHIRKRADPTLLEQAQEYLNKFKVQHIRSSPKMMMGMLFGFLLMIILIVVALHYFRLYSFPFLGFIPQKPAPASHLQYFFF